MLDKEKIKEYFQNTSTEKILEEWEAIEDFGVTWDEYLKVEFIPSNVHQGHYIVIDGKTTGIVVNLFAYKTIEDYKKRVGELPTHAKGDGVGFKSHHSY